MSPIQLFTTCTPFSDQYISDPRYLPSVIADLKLPRRTIKVDVGESRCDVTVPDGLWNIFMGCWKPHNERLTLDDMHSILDSMPTLPYADNFTPPQRRGVLAFMARVRDQIRREPDGMT